MDTLAAIGPAEALVAFADTAVAWKRLIADFRDAGGRPSPTAATAREETRPPSDAMLV